MSAETIVTAEASDLNASVIIDGGICTPETPSSEYMDGLPAPEYWLKDPELKIKTPTNSRGLVDVDELVAEVMQYISADFEWGSWNDMHHLNWPRCDYVAARKSGAIPHATLFRELPTNRVWWQRPFHNVVHKVTIPTPMPHPNVMAEQIEAWDIAESFFNRTRLAATLERKKFKPRRNQIVQPDELLLLEAENKAKMQTISSQFKGEADDYLQQLQSLPVGLLPEHMSQSRTAAIKKAGELVVKGCHQRVRVIRLAA